MRVLPNDAGVSCADNFSASSPSAVLFRASFGMVVENGTDAAAKIVTFFAKLYKEFRIYPALFVASD